MSFYDDASLVFLPSGEAGKDGKAYSMKPTNGNGDFTFSRGSNLTATRVDSNGLIEKGRENLILQSNQFDTTWSKNPSNVSITSGFSGYDGSNNAWKLEAVSDNNFSVISQTISNAGVETFSVYAKAGTSNFIRIHITGGTNTSASYFDLSGSGSVGTNFNNIDAKIESVGNGWFRCSVTGNKTTSTTCVIYVVDANGSSNVTTGANIYIQDAQLEIGLVATEYIESGATTGKAGLLEDSPRFDYSGGASCPSLLLEPSRTNLVGQSEYIDSWNNYTSGNGAAPTITTNYIESPEGIVNATRLQLETNGTSSTDASGVLQSIALDGSSTYIFSFWIKSNSGSSAELSTFINSSFGVQFTATTEWQRLDFEVVSNSTNPRNFGIVARGNYHQSVDVSFWGAQLELGSYSTSYIPNHSGGSVTRELDHCFTSSNSVLEEINATYFLEVTPIQIASNNLLEVRANGSINNRILLQTSSLGVLRVLVRAQGSSVLDQNISGAVSANTKVKIALKYTDRTNISVFVDGVKEIDTDLVIDFSPELNGLDLEGSATANNDSLKQHQFIFFPTALSDANCITLTS